MRENCDYEEDEKFSKRPEFQRDYDKFYKSNLFRNKYLSKMYKRNVPTVVEVIRSDDVLLQQKVGVDAVIELSNKNHIPVDEKTDRPKYNKSPNIFLEIVSNPKSEYRTDGWAYHRGIHICYGSSNDDMSGLVEREPVFFFIDEDFINMFTRNNKYETKHCSKLTNGLYASIGRKVPRVDIFAYLNGGNNGQAQQPLF